MLGMYSGLVCYLINTRKWVLAKDSNGDPSHISRSSIHFKAPGGLPGKVTINDPLSSFFLVTYEGPSEVASELCPFIRGTILTGISHVSKNLNYFPLHACRDEAISNQPKMPEITFLCPCHTTPLHPATMSDNRKYLTCPEDFPCYEKVTENHQIWFGGKSSSMDYMRIPLIIIIIL